MALADHACKAGERRLTTDPARLAMVHFWLDSPNMCGLCAAVVVTPPPKKQNDPTATKTAARARILGWAERAVPDREWFFQKSVSWWMLSLTIHDPERVQACRNGPGRDLKSFTPKDATRRIG